jgi:hypothetical protein
MLYGDSSKATEAFFDKQSMGGQSATASAA